ncbi:hypothetical protein K1719_017319 [Acacia pycnantha]|nr:hypothetical protein K1719_017319 [Acacia pycnantha]
MSMIKPVTLISSPPKSPCSVTHRCPALVFSAGGYTGNFFHEFNENFIPLFITVHSLYPDRDVVLLITQGATWWFHKYAELLSSFTQHPIINANNSTTTTTTHCFSSATVGLMKHGPITIDPKQLPDPKTLVDFCAWLKNIYIGPGIFPPGESKPSLTLVSRRGSVSRVILNEEEIVRLAEEVGFNVRLLEASRDKSMAEDYKRVHTSHVLLGVHGAGLTHLLFLRPGTVMMQVVPIGLEWAARTYYGEKTSRVLGLEYVEYKVEANESSLSEKYGRESLVMKNPEGFHGGDWSKRRIYLREQDVKLNVTRFSKYLTEAYEKARAFMDKYG